MNSYNGFSPKQRYKALDYHKKQIKLGLKPKEPNLCDCCGVSNGFLQWHSEDYSEPFGPHIGEYGVCYRCHMHIHCRFRNPKAFDAYCMMISNGKRFVPYLNNNWKRFKYENLMGNLYGDIESIQSDFDTSKSLILRLKNQNGEPLIELL